MCGIYSSIGFQPDQRRIDIVAHRGPDGRGWQEFASPAGPVAMGHRRLAVIDTSHSGLQPMADPSGRFHLVFNGELYNYLELRNELQGYGELFQTETDSEVLLRAYTYWGVAALDRFRGMFAFVIYDKANNHLFAARDRFGIKPLYLLATAHGVAFASEIKQLLGLPGLSGRMNLARIYDFLSEGVVDHTAETMFENVMQLRGGECALVKVTNAGSIDVRISRWYRAEAQEPAILSDCEAAERFRALLTDAVRLHLRSDVPVGSCLSGGLDSSSIVCLASEMLQRRNDGAAHFNTVSACYAEKNIDETPFIDAVVKQANVKPYFVFPRAEDMLSRAAKIIWHQEEPFGSTSIFAQWCVFGAARRAGIKVMLDGQGADEQLAGYHACFSVYLASLLRGGQLRTALRTLRERRKFHGASLGGQLSLAIRQFMSDGLVVWARRQREVLARHNWLAGYCPHQHGGTVLPRADNVGSLCKNMTFVSNLPSLLHWEDRNSMAHSIEARVPFLDHPLVEFSLALGDNHKLVGGTTKSVLRFAMQGILPPAVHQRNDKLSFVTPEQVWFRGPLKEMIMGGIEATLRRYPNLLNAAGTRALAAEMVQGRRPVDSTLWRVVCLGLWGEQFAVSV